MLSSTSAAPQLPLALAAPQKDTSASAFLMSLMEHLEKEKAAGLPLPPPKIITRPAPAPAPTPAPAPAPAPAPESAAATAEETAAAASPAEGGGEDGGGDGGEGGGGGGGGGAAGGGADALRLKEEGKLVLTLGKASGLKRLGNACVTACVGGVERKSKAAKGEGELCYDEALEFTGVLAKLVAQGLRLKLTERNPFSKDEVLVALDP